MYTVSIVIWKGGKLQLIVLCLPHKFTEKMRVTGVITQGARGLEVQSISNPTKQHKSNMEKPDNVQSERNQ